MYMVQQTRAKMSKMQNAMWGGKNAVLKMRKKLKPMHTVAQDDDLVSNHVDRSTLEAVVFSGRFLAILLRFR